MEELQGDLPSNHLQSHARVQYTGDTIYPSQYDVPHFTLTFLLCGCHLNLMIMFVDAVSELDILENCDFISQVAYPHKLRKQYEGIYQVRSTLSLNPTLSI